MLGSAFFCNNNSKAKILPEAMAVMIGVALKKNDLKCLLMLFYSFYQLLIQEALIHIRFVSVLWRNGVVE